MSDDNEKISIGSVSGSWTENESQYSSTWRELEAVKRVVKNKAKATLIIPEWKSSPFWPMLFDGLKLQSFVNRAVQDSGVPLTSKLGNLSNHMSNFQRWKKFISDHSYSEIPAKPVRVALYITHLLDNGASYSTVNSTIYSIKWMHSLCGLDDPTENSFVKSLQESAKRLAAKPVRRKDPIDNDMLQSLCSLHKDTDDVLILRNLAMILLGFAGFLRFDEISSLKCSNILVGDDYLKLFIEKSKNDQLREGNEVLIAKDVICACPYNMFLRYVYAANINLLSSDFIFKPVFRSKGVAKLINKNKPISYTAAKENIVSMLKSVAPNLNIGIHSLRSGGASVAANSNVDERCIQRHGRWKCVSRRNANTAHKKEHPNVAYRLNFHKKEHPNVACRLNFQNCTDFNYHIDERFQENVPLTLDEEEKLNVQKF
ncbi:integrase/recombinase xerD homolog [Saccostrea echinata]|uniref:integrase/recombinase xerD homolog n=1 Tax=Saccostrea echinata TaxID=191078 RepID=UPI002A83F099|nr:integrase/recombinase xerD homolog [Saccostrea echinata]